MKRPDLRPLLGTSVPSKRGRRFPVVVALLVVGAGVYASLPASTRELGPPPRAFGPIVRGVMHVHTNRSDGSGTIDEVADAAARAGMQFVVITDHGDGTRAPEPPSYRSGVLCLDAVEISTEHGHLVAIGLPQSPYPLGGEGRDAVDDVARLGGFAIAAHPGSPRPSSRWSEWTAPFGGLEWLNGDSEWRDEGVPALARALMTYPFRARETVAALLDRSDVVMSRWDALTRRRRVVAVAASDAHARFGVPDESGPLQRLLAVPVPGYRPVFSAFSVALPDVALTGRPDVDAQRVVDAIRRGHVYSLVDGVAGPGALRVSASSGRHRASTGDLLPLDGPVRIRAEVHGPSCARIVLFRNGAPVLETQDSVLEHTADGVPSTFRIEVYAPGAPAVPWIVSNPVYAGMAENVAVPPRRAATTTVDAQPMTSWVIEHSTASQGAADVVQAADGSRQALFRYALSGAPASFPYVAMVIPRVPALPQYDRLTFRIRADKAGRVSVQLRERAAEGHRWHRSVYADTNPRDVTIFFDEMSPRAGGPSGRPPLGEIGSVLFVVDSVNTRVGTGGRITIDLVKFGRSE